MSECIIAEGGRHPEERWGSWGVDAAAGRDEEAARGTREISQGLRSGADDGKDVEGSEMDGGFSKEDVCRDVEVGSWLMLSPVTTLFSPSGGNWLMLSPVTTLLSPSGGNCLMLSPVTTLFSPSGLELEAKHQMKIINTINK